MACKVIRVSSMHTINIPQFNYMGMYVYMQEIWLLVKF